MKPRRVDRRRALAWSAAASLIFSAASAAAQTAAATRPLGQAGSAQRLGLALGGGSARGFAHIGVLKALDEAGYKADVLSGTSAGALVGAYYAAGYTPWQIEEVALKVRDIDVADLNSASKRGMFAGEALQRLVNEQLHQRSIERFKLPYCAVATQLQSGDLVAIRSGDAGLAVRASCAIPGVFVPAVVNGVELVDGGLVSPLPVKQARDLGAHFVIAVDVGTLPRNNTSAGLYEVILQSFEIMSRALTQLEAQQADLVIRPDTSRFNSTDFNSRKELIQAGYEAARKALPELQKRWPQRAKPA
jgi:NTE family protein